MSNTDSIQRFIFENADVRGEIVNLSHSYRLITEQHQYPQTIKYLLGQALTVACLLTAIVKFKGRLTVQFQGKNPLKLLLAQCNNEFEIRGLVQSQGELSEQEVLAALKEGILAIIISPDATTTRNQGIVAWQGDSLAQSIEGYFKDSEQIPTRIWLAVNETSAVGMLLQPLPKENSRKTQPITTDNDWEHIVHLTDTITDEELLTLDSQTILHRLYSQEEVRVFEPAAVNFRCTCSLERSENAILMIGKDEAEQELKDKLQIVVTCEFCNKSYEFDRVDVENIFKKNDSSTQQMH